jgi:hypothetical protein
MSAAGGPWVGLSLAAVEITDDELVAAVVQDEALKLSH